MHAKNKATKQKSPLHMLILSPFQKSSVYAIVYTLCTRKAESFGLNFAKNRVVMSEFKSKLKRTELVECARILNVR